MPSTERFPRARVLDASSWKSELRTLRIGCTPPGSSMNAAATPVAGRMPARMKLWRRFQDLIGLAALLTRPCRAVPGHKGSVPTRCPASTRSPAPESSFGPGQQSVPGTVSTKPLPRASASSSTTARPPTTPRPWHPSLTSLTACSWNGAGDQGISNRSAAVRRHLGLANQLRGRSELFLPSALGVYSKRRSRRSPSAHAPA